MLDIKEFKMAWYNYVAYFFAGAFFTNAVPHFVHGVSGDKFPTPFANPPGKGLSSPQLNVLWALFNLIMGSLLTWGGKIFVTNILGLIIFFLGVSAMSIRLSFSLSGKHQN
jgi:hypothetical protein